MNYFAYGSNLHSQRLRARVPSAQPLGSSTLASYSLRWHKRGRDGSGKCNCFRTEQVEDHVVGVIYRISSDEKHALDAAEGLGVGYDLAWLDFEDFGQVFTYVAREEQIDDNLRPYQWYWRFVIEGAREHQLPPEYIDDLALVAHAEDPNRDRHAQNLQILNLSA